VLLVVAVLLTPITLAVRWVNFEISSEDRFVGTLAPLASDPEVQQAVANRLTTEIFALVDLQDLAEDALPDQAAFLSGPLTSAVQDFAQQEVLTFLESEQFAQIWEEALRIAHRAMDALLQGKDDGAVQVEDGRVVLDLQSVADIVVERLSDRGLTVVENIPTERINVQITLFESKALADAQAAVELLQTLSWVLLVIALGCYVAAALLTGGRRGVLRSAVGLVVGAALLGLLLALGRAAYVDALVNAGANRAVQEIVFNQVVSSLRTALRALAAIGVVIGFAIWVTGPSRPASAIRRQVNKVMGRGAVELQARSDGDEQAPALQWFGRHERTIEVVVLVLAALLLFSWTQPSASTVLWLALGTLVVLGIVAFLARVGRVDDQPAAASTDRGPDDDGEADGGDADSGEGEGAGAAETAEVGPAT